MTEDASLTDFADDAGATDDTEAAPHGDADAEPRDDADGASQQGTDDPTPATSTYGWSPDGDACPECGRTVERRWRDGERLVCADCKAW